MKKLTSGLVVAGLGAIALSGGVTYALWNDGAHITAGGITSGDLSVKQVAPPQWTDTSPDVPGNPQPIDLATFRYAPGDTATMRQSVSVQLDGDNLRAAMAVTVPALQGSVGLSNGVSGTYSILDTNGVTLPGASRVDLGQPTTIPAVASGTYTLEVDLAFGRPTVVGADSETTSLSTTDFRLQQIRP